MHDLIIASPSKASRQDVMAYAQRLGLDQARFQQDLDSGNIGDRFKLTYRKHNAALFSVHRSFFLPDRIRIAK